MGRIQEKSLILFAGEFNGTTLEAYIESPYSRTNHWAFKFFHGIGKWLVIASALFNLAREVNKNKLFLIKKKKKNIREVKIVEVVFSVSRNMSST